MSKGEIRKINVYIQNKKLVNMASFLFAFPLPNHIFVSSFHRLFVSSFLHIEYKSIRHGYARIDKNGELLITIPLRKKNDQAFINELTKKGEQLLQRYNKKTHITPIQKDSILLFGEEVPIKDISSDYPSLSREDGEAGWV